MTDRKQQALIQMALRGTEEEQKIAKRLCRKYDIELVLEIIQIHYFKYKGTFEKNLFVQIVTMVGNRELTVQRRRGRGNTLEVECTTKQQLEIELYYSIYKRKLAEEFEIQYIAFVQSQNIFAEAAEEPEERELTKKDWEIINRANKIDKIQIQNQLGFTN